MLRFSVWGVLLAALTVHAIFIVQQQSVGMEAVWYQPKLSPGPAKKSWITITDDLGGAVPTYALRFDMLEASHAKIVIKGDCMSACTRFMQLSRACAMPNAMFWFHAARRSDTQQVLAVTSIVDTVLHMPKALPYYLRYGIWHMGIVSAIPPDAVAIGGTWILKAAPDAYLSYSKEHDGIHVILGVPAEKFIPPCLPRRGRGGAVDENWLSPNFTTKTADPTEKVREAY